MSSRAPEPRARPDDALLFSPVGDRYGPRLALVFGNEAPGGLCPYYRAGRCAHCDIGAGEGGAFDAETNRTRLRWFEGHYSAQWPRLAHLVVYNSGSVLNPRELSPAVLVEIARFAASLPQLRALSLDAREPYIRLGTLEPLVRRLGPSQAARPILGLESADDRVRDELLQKRMPRSAVERAYDAVAELASRHGEARIGIDVNVVVGAPGTDRETAAEEAAATARYALSLGAERDLGVDLNIHPYYPSHRSSTRFSAHPRCSPQTAVSALLRIDGARRELMPAAGVFVGWQDEQHDQQQELRAAELSRWRSLFDRFNRTQDAALFGAFSP